MAAGYGDPNSNSPVKIGSIISCITCFDTVLQGEVLSFEPQNKLLALKQPSTGKRGRSDIVLVNLNYVKDVTISQEPMQQMKELVPLNIEKLRKREEEETENKRRQSDLLERGISLEAQKLFLSIQKTFECEWQDQSILVAKDVIIHPPYRPDNCDGNPKAIEHIRKLIDKFHRDQRNGSS